MRLRININAEVLERSMFCSSGKPLEKITIGEADVSNCAIALAIRDLFPFAIITIDEIRFLKEEHMKMSALTVIRDISLKVPRCTLPQRASNFIQEFDAACYEERLDLEQFSFEIDVPEEVINSISIDDLNKALVGSTTMEIV
jgi:hypothetical protein